MATALRSCVSPIGFRLVRHPSRYVRADMSQIANENPLRHPVARRTQAEALRECPDPCGYAACGASCGRRTSRRHQPCTGDKDMDMLEPGKFGTAVPFRKRYGNYIGGEWVAPVDNQYFENITPVTGKVFCEVPRSTAADI